jgi:hypothetical protein
MLSQVLLDFLRDLVVLVSMLSQFSELGRTKNIIVAISIQNHFADSDSQELGTLLPFGYSFLGWYVLSKASYFVLVNQKSAERWAPGGVLPKAPYILRVSRRTLPGWLGKIIEFSK